MAAGDTFRAAASDQLEIWAERTGCEIVVAESEKAKASSGTNGIKFFSCICNLSLSNFIASIIGLFVVVDTKFCTCCITCSAFTGCKKGKRARF